MKNENIIFFPENKDGDSKMEKKIKYLIFLLFFLISLGNLLSHRLHGANSEGKISKRIRIAIFHPVESTLRSLHHLKAKGLITLEDFEVIGYYHEKELTDFNKAREYVNNNKIEWFKFHRIEGELSSENIFGENPCTPVFRDIFEQSDGMIFFGGEDIPPRLYKEKTSFLTSIVTPYRHLLELSIIFHLLGGYQDESFRPFLEAKQEYPVLFICLGCQSLNVGLGGSLIQDIWSEVYGKSYLEDVALLPRENWHRNPYRHLFPELKIAHYLLHPISFTKESRFLKILGLKPEDHVYVLSSHHQAVEKLGKGLRVAATSVDGRVVEAIEHQKYPNILGVQFHPEYPGLYEKTLTFLIKPDEQEGENFLKVLLDNPPSYDFHKKLWAWFSEKTKESSQNRNKE